LPARRPFVKGEQHFKAREFDAAAAAFKESAELAPAGPTFLNAVNSILAKPLLTPTDLSEVERLLAKGY
jgi:hypothetical protein